MTAIVYMTTHSIADWVSRIAHGYTRFFTRLGYARAAGELRRLGYHNEADACLKEMRKL